MMTFLTIQPIIFGRWNLSLSYGEDERGYYTRFDLAGEWLVANEDLSLNFNMPFVYFRNGLSLTDAKLGVKVRFSEKGLAQFNLIFPTGRYSSRNPAGELQMGGYISRFFLNFGGIFTASSDTQEYSFYNKVSQRRAYRHMYFEGLTYRYLGEVLGVGFGVRGDYAYSLNQFWTSVKMGIFLAPFLEIGGEVWLYKPRPEAFRVYILGNFFI
ncbi:hypothetical protein LM594_00120 [Candidatus Caldipriscus sp.]|nr:hypothetical protein [Candidatus Caldipriscus sp.]